MRRRSKRTVNHHHLKSLVPVKGNRSRPVFPERRYEVAGRILRVTTYVPRPVAHRVRREIYPYPYPKQIQKKGRSVRVSLKPLRGPYVKAVVRIRLPRRLPAVRGSYVTVRPKLLTIHSRNQLERTINAQEYNRRRYAERKGNKRKAWHGQLDSRGNSYLGIAAHASRSGKSIDQIGNAALAARAIAGKKGR